MLSQLWNLKAWYLLLNSVNSQLFTETFMHPHTEKKTLHTQKPYKYNYSVQQKPDGKRALKADEFK